MTDPPNLQTLLTPFSIAVTGAFSKKGRVGNIISKICNIRPKRLTRPVHVTIFQPIVEVLKKYRKETILWQKIFLK